LGITVAGIAFLTHDVFHWQLPLFHWTQVLACLLLWVELQDVISPESCVEWLLHAVVPEE
jgi:hypothetical protein